MVHRPQSKPAADHHSQNMITRRRCRSTVFFSPACPSIRRGSGPPGGAPVSASLDSSARKTGHDYAKAFMEELG